MKIHEYQAKEILRKYGVATPRGFPCFSLEEATSAADKLGGGVWVVKAQIHAGGRGKGGGVKVAKSKTEVRNWAGQILGMQLVTHQTGPIGQKVRRLLVEEGADIAKELYVGMVVDRGTQRVCLMASSEGGMDIEEVAARTPERIHKVFIDPATGLKDAEADDVARKIGVPEPSVAQARVMLQGLYRAFWESDASLAEINPLILTREGRVVALDAKMNFDDNALFRHPEILAMRDLDEEDPAEVEAAKYDLSYIQLDVGSFQPYHQRHLETDHLRRLDHAGGDDVAAHDAAENVDQDGLHVRVAEDDLEGRGDAFLGGVAADIEEVRRRAALELDDVHGRHGEAGAVDHATDFAI